MSITKSAIAVAAAGGYDRRRELLQEFDDTKAGVKGLVDSGTKSIPAIFHHPLDSLGAINPLDSLGAITSSTTDNDEAVATMIPVIDLAAAQREEVVALVRAAAETAGFFQVVNHGVPGEAMAAILAAARRFHEGTMEEKRPYYPRDTTCKVRFFSNLDLFRSPAASWRDNVICNMVPVPSQPEELPEALRGVMFGYVDAVRKVAAWVFELLSESLGLASHRLAEMGCRESLRVACNYYPSCPEPHLTMGHTKHTDPTFLTVLLQDAMGGLLVFLDHGGRQKGWVNVPPVPGALIINIGDLLQLVSNGRFRSVEHRVLANQSADTARVSVAAFVSAGIGSTRQYGPIEELTPPDGGNPPLYRSVTAEEFMAHFYRKGISENRPRLDDFKLE